MAAHRAAESSAAGFVVDAGVAHSQNHLSLVTVSPRAAFGRLGKWIAVENLRRIRHTAHYIPELFGAT